MVVVGIVGRIAAGKSTAARLLAARGAEVIDADRIAHEVLDEPGVRREIADRFGPGVCDAEGLVLRPPLATEVFGPTAAHDAALADLEAIVHPRVRRQIEERLAALRKHSAADKTVVVLDVPLLMQAHWYDLCDWLLLVECPEDERRRRLDALGWPAEQRAARELAWNRGYRSPPPEKTLFIEASGDEAYTLKQVGRIWDSLRRV